jgi:mono/diheme cytochrome c family protein
MSSMKPILGAGIVIFLSGAFALSAWPAGNTETASAVTENSAVAVYQKAINPILEDHCYECHGDGYNKGKVAFDELETNAQILDKDLWLRVLVNTRAGLMPAEQKPRLSAAEQLKLERWIKSDVFHLDPRNLDPGRVTVRRLNRVEYRNTVRDLLGVDFNAEVEFPPDDTGFGFDNIGDALSISPMLVEKYVAAATLIVAEAVPAADRVIAKQEVPASAFAIASGEKAGGEKKSAPLRFPYNASKSVATSVKTPGAGSYKVTLGVDVRGDFVYVPDRGRLVFKIDGKEVLNKEFVYFNEKSFTFESDHKWTSADHQISLEFTSLDDGKATTDKNVKGPKSSRLTVSTLTIEGPLENDKWVKPANYDRFFPRPIPAGRAERLAYARELLGAFASKAYRRPLEGSDDTADRLAKLAEDTYRQKGKTFEQGVAQAMAAVLSSPHFLFRLEQPAPHPVDAFSAPVDEYSLASRLSYFLWSTMPDDELLALAARGELRANLAAQVKRMLADERAQSLAQNFTGQWLESRDLEGLSSNAREILIRDAGEEENLRLLRQAFRSQDFVNAKKLAALIDAAVDPKIELNADLRKAMREETELYFKHIVKDDRPVTELIDSNYAYLNEELAKHYGIAGVSGEELRLVTLPAGSPRGGVLTQGSSLIVTSNPDRTSPVKRGLFVLANFLGTPPPPPPANVPALEASEVAHEGREPTLRESLTKHREDPACSSCHNRMDPIGLAFENFNALGMWRDTERKQSILAPGKLITGETFDSVSELKHILATAHREDFYRTLTTKLLTYATGRGPEYYDVETIDQIVRQLDQNDGKFSAMLMGVIESAPFQKMRTQATVTAAN